MLALLVSAAVAASADPGFGYHLGALSEARAERGPGAALQLVPLAEIGAQSRTFRASLGYRPRALIGPDTSTLHILHRAALAVDWTPSRATRVSAGQELSRGQTDLSWIAAAAEGGVPSLDRYPQFRGIEFQQSQSVLAVDQKLARALQLRLQGSYGVSGGADRQARLSVPLFRVWVGGAGLTAKATRTESFGLGVQASFARSSPQNQKARTLDASFRWEHDFSRRVRMLAGAGVGVTHNEITRARPVDTVAPTFVLSLSRRPPARGKALTYALAVRYVPFVSPTDGSVLFRPEATADVGAPLTNRVSLRLVGAAARVVTFGPNRTLAWGLSGAVETAVGPGLSLSAGIRAVKQPDPTWAVFVAVNISQLGKF
jgi:hypothetical protein